MTEGEELVLLELDNDLIYKQLQKLELLQAGSEIEWKETEAKIGDLSFSVRREQTLGSVYIWNQSDLKLNENEKKELPPPLATVDSIYQLHFGKE